MLKITGYAEKVPETVGPNKYENVVSKKTVSDVATSLKGRSQLVGSCQSEVALVIGQVFLTDRYKTKVIASVVGKLKFR